MSFSAKYLLTATPIAAALDWYDIPVKVSKAVCALLYAQPDAKLANGMYWAEFWMGVVGLL